MVNRGRRGASAAGCLVSLLVVIAMLYYGINLGRVWWRYWEIQDRMKTAARFSTTQTDAELLARLRADAQDLGLPPEAGRFRIQRLPATSTIVIATEYQEHVDLPLLKRAFVMKPQVSVRR